MPRRYSSARRLGPDVLPCLLHQFYGDASKPRETFDIFTGPTFDENCLEREAGEGRSRGREGDQTDGSGPSVGSFCVNEIKSTCREVFPFFFPHGEGKTREQEKRSSNDRKSEPRPCNAVGIELDHGLRWLCTRITRYEECEWPSRVTDSYTR